MTTKNNTKNGASQDRVRRRKAHAHQSNHKRMDNAFIANCAAHSDQAFVLTVTCPNHALADAVLSERLGFDEDYGFPYRLDWRTFNNPGRKKPGQDGMIVSRYVVLVDQCAPEQARRVMEERINFDEDYGYEYALEWDSWAHRAKADDPSIQTAETAQAHAPAGDREACTVVLEEVAAELNRAIAKFPRWPDKAEHAIAVLAEEFGETAESVMAGKAAEAHTREEAVQAAAMAVRFAANIDRYTFDAPRRAIGDDPFRGILGIADAYGRLSKAVLQASYEPGPGKYRPEDVRRLASLLLFSVTCFMESLDDFRYEPGPQHWGE